MGRLDNLPKDAWIILLQQLPPHDCVVLFTTGSLLLRRHLTECVNRMTIGVASKRSLHLWPNIEALALDFRMRRVESLDLSSYMNLRYLDLPYSLESTGIALGELPHLISLKAVLKDVEGFLNTTKAPLESLRLLTRGSFRAECLDNLPETLTTLEFPNAIMTGQTTRIQTALCRLETLFVPGEILIPHLAMPRSLKHLTMIPNGIDASFLTQLPSTLESLTADKFTDFSATNIPQLPPNLTRLQLFEAGIPTESLKLLPTGLKSLFIERLGGPDDWPSVGRMSAISEWPGTSLRELSLDPSIPLSANDIIHLPRTLKRLHMSDSGLSGEATLNLPPCLEFLNLHLRTSFFFNGEQRPWVPFIFDPEYISKLPLSIQKLKLNEMKSGFPALLFERLPTSLSSIEVPFIDDFVYNVLFDLRECTTWEEATKLTKRMRELLHNHANDYFRNPYDSYFTDAVQTAETTPPSTQTKELPYMKQRRLIIHTVFPRTVEFSAPIASCDENSSIAKVNDMVEFMKLVHKLYELVSKESGRTGLAPLEVHNILLPSCDLSKLPNIHHVFTIRDNRRLRNDHSDARFVALVSETRSKYPLRLSLASFPLYNDVAVGGTFDYLHAGHKMLLSACLLSARKRLVIGITGAPLLVKKSHKDYMQAYEMRRKNVENFCRLQRPELYLELVELLEPAGPTAHDPNFDLIVVSEETAAGIATINDIREKKGLRAMKGLTIQLSAASESMRHLSADVKISSTTLRLRQKMLEEHLYAKNPLATPPPYVTPTLCADPDFSTTSAN